MAARRPRILVVGGGRLGGALALSLSAHRWPVSVLSRTDEGRSRVLGLGLKLATRRDMEQARVALLCVPDKAVPEVAREMARTLGRGTALVR
jgi:prephenate dehydrogenase